MHQLVLTCNGNVPNLIEQKLLHLFLNIDFSNKLKK